MLYFATFIAAVAVTMVLIPPLVQYAGRFQLLDRPNERKVHAVSIPRVGGIGMVLGALVPIFIWISPDRHVISYVMGVGALLIFGIWDDRGDLDYRLKFLGQILAAIVVVVYGDVLIRVVPFFGLDPVSNWVSVPLTVFVLVAVTNAVNLADGLDGLASGTTLLSLAGIALLAYLSNGSELLVMTIAIIGVIVGFLRFNTHPARVFMGDTGSQFLGFSAGILAILLTQQVSPALNPALPLLMLGLPLFDTAFVMAKRIYRGKSPFAADRNHVHHQLLKADFNHYEAVVIIYVVQSFFVVSAILFRYQGDMFVVGYWVTANVMFALTLVGAARWHWGARRPERGSLLATWIPIVADNLLTRTVPLAILRIAVVGLLIAGPVLVDDVPVDIGVVSGVLFVLLSARLIFGFRLWFLFLRLLLFVAVATVIYLAVTYPGRLEEVPQLVIPAFFALVVAALVTGARFSQQDAFRVTPTDTLVVLVFLGVALAPRIGLANEAQIGIAVRALIMFYAVEFILRNMESRWCALTVSALWAFGVIGVRGVLLG